GNIDLDYLMENMEVGIWHDVPVLAVDPHGAAPLEHYILARSFIYSQLVHHKTVAAAELLLRALLLQAVEESTEGTHPIIPRTIAGIEKWFETTQSLYKLTDAYILARIADAA